MSKAGPDRPRDVAIPAAARRILLVGAPGGGKTTLARRLSARLGVPWFELDAVIYEGGAGTKRPFAERLRLAREIASRPGWVAEGNYLWWAEELYRAAELVVWLDLPWHVALGRMITRHLTESVKGTNRHPGLQKLARFIWPYRKYYFSREPDAPEGPQDDRAGNRAATALFLHTYADKLVRCRNQRDIEELSKNLMA